MAIYRSNEVRKMSPKERAEKLDELRAELLREHGVKAAGGALKNPGRIRALRKTIARILTIGSMEAREAMRLALAGAPAVRPGASFRDAPAPKRPSGGSARAPRGKATGKSAPAARRGPAKSARAPSVPSRPKEERASGAVGRPSGASKRDSPARKARSRKT